MTKTETLFKFPMICNHDFKIQTIIIIIIGYDLYYFYYTKLQPNFAE